MTSKRLIISRTDAIGDVILTLPMVGILKKMFPDIYIIFLGATYTKPIIDCCKNVDEFLDWNTLKNLEEPAQIERFKSLKADTLIHVFPRKEIARLAKKANIQNRIGTSHRLFHWTTCNKMVNFSRKNSTLHEAQLNLKLLSAFGISTETYTLDKMIQFVDFKSPEINFETLELLDNHRFNLILHPKSKGSAREWGIKNFSRLIDILPPEQFKIFLCGTEQEKSQMQDLLHKTKENVVDLTGKLTLPEYIAFINAADGLLAASTGPLHIAAVLGKHALGIYPPIRPMHSERWSPIGKNVKIFELNVKCSYCRKTQDCECMKGIEPEMIKDYLLNFNN